MMPKSANYTKFYSILNILCHLLFKKWSYFIMKKLFEELRQKEYINDFALKITNTKFRQAIQDISLHYFTPEKEIDFNQYQGTFNNIKNSTAIIFDQYLNSESDQEGKYFIICFKKTLILIKQCAISFIRHLFTMNDKIGFCFLNNSKKVFDENIKIQYKELTNDNFFQKVLNIFIKKFLFYVQKNFI